MDDQSPAPPTPATDKLQTLLEGARKGDLSLLPDLRAALDEHPEIWRESESLAVLVERAWIQQIGGQDLLFREVLVQQMAAMRADLAGPSATRMELLLVERVIACWLQVQYSDAAAVSPPEGTPLQLGEFALKRQDQANRRYLMALGALESYRRMLPAAQRIEGTEAPDIDEGNGHSRRLRLAINGSLPSGSAREQQEERREGAAS